jgi:hypothetical protein
VNPTEALTTARGIMEWYARSTGLEPAGTDRRYLWTDAFAVCNYLSLYQATGEEADLRLALTLVDRVHHVLGRHRLDDQRRGWISGLEEEEGELHPTAGGLRIGKSLPEREPLEPYDPEAEWDRDGQYYHYLTRWMWALGRVSRVTREPRYHAWAVELAAAAQRAFVRAPGPSAPGLIHWKMSIDLTRPLVPSMGQHDALDGLVTLYALQAMAPGGPSVLGDEIAVLEAMCRGGTWATADPLGIGGLLTDGYRLVQLAARGRGPGEEFLTSVLEQARWSLEAFDRSRALERFAAARLPFRELGMAIGLAAVARMTREAARSAVRLPPDVVAHLMRHVPLAEAIEAFWLDPGHREAESWTGHTDINAVMLATALVPDGYLDL